MNDLAAQLKTALADRAHFIEVNRMLRDRPDLGDRAKSVDLLLAIVEAATTPPHGYGDGHPGLWQSQRLDDAIEALVRKVKPGFLPEPTF